MASWGIGFAADFLGIGSQKLGVSKRQQIPTPQSSCAIVTVRIPGLFSSRSAATATRFDSHWYRISIVSARRRSSRHHHHYQHHGHHHRHQHHHGATSSARRATTPAGLPPTHSSQASRSERRREFECIARGNRRHLMVTEGPVMQKLICCCVAQAGSKHGD
jgi:hypothetical protein